MIFNKGRFMNEHKTWNNCMKINEALYLTYSSSMFLGTLWNENDKIKMLPDEYILRKSLQKNVDINHSKPYIEYLLRSKSLVRWKEIT